MRVYLNCLGDYPYFVTQLQLYTNRDEVVKLLHTLLYGDKGSRDGRIERICKFRGFHEHDIPAKSQIVAKWPKWCVVTCLKLFGGTGKGQSALINYLSRPWVINEDLCALDPKQTYILIEGRKLRNAYPKVSVRSIETSLSLKWNRLTQAEREEWQSMNDEDACLNRTDRDIEDVHHLDVAERLRRLRCHVLSIKQCLQIQANANDTIGFSTLDAEAFDERLQDILEGVNTLYMMLLNTNT